MGESAGGGGQEGTEGKDERVEGWRREGRWQDGGRRTGRAEDTAAPEPLMCHISRSLCTRTVPHGEEDGGSNCLFSYGEEKQIQKKHLKTLQILVFDSKRKRTSWALLAPTVPSGPGPSAQVTQQRVK